MSEIQEGKCDPPDVQRNPVTGPYSVCLYAVPFFECALEWDPHSFATASCIAGSCGGGKVAKLMAEMEYCAIQGGGTLELELKICVDVLSDVIRMIGKYISAVESFMNSKFNIYRGYVFIFAYDIQHHRFETTASCKRYWDGTLFSLKIEANCKSKDICVLIVSFI